MSDYKDLNVWKESMDLVESVYKLVRFLPKELTLAQVSCIYASDVKTATGEAQSGELQVLAFLEATHSESGFF